jgi:hypothetical protein
MASFERILTQELGIPEDIDFSRSISVFQSDAMRNIVTIGESRIYIEGLQGGENAVIEEKIRETQAEQRSLIQRELLQTADRPTNILSAVLEDLNLDGRTRRISTRRILTDAVRGLF